MLRLLLDENVPKNLVPLLVGHEVRTTTQMLWSGIQNGVLLRLAAPEFDVLLTCDRSLPNQQHVAAMHFAVLVLRARRNRPEDLAPLVPEALIVLQDIRPGEVSVVYPPAAPAEPVIP